MHFSSSVAPTLTPLGVRLLSLSNRKLTDLEAPVGSREPGFALLRGVLVREAVRSAWASLEQGPTELTNWRAPTALGLDTLSEEDEDEEDELETVEQRWLDDVLDESDEDGVSVMAASDYDVEYYDVNGLQAYTLDSAVTYGEETTASSDVTVVEVAAVDDDDEYDEDEYTEVAATWLELSEPEKPQHVEDVAAEPEAVAEAAATPTYGDYFGYAAPGAEDDACLQQSPPPLMRRSLSSCSTDSLDDEDDNCCRTPPLDASSSSLEDLDDLSAGLSKAFALNEPAEYNPKQQQQTRYLPAPFRRPFLIDDADHDDRVEWGVGLAMVSA
ncbi:uncharacterized protein LOC62_06G008716 [Vanrija pseudolonga]|uniref:Uncharacterized protein n=1 Tax=Vanrija pseudolonga TaxID=143232 RepID=A0AAF0YGL7_9TREE|nr:hypothetical protein LOC62_06G008716 [Vanrija pseudolonga]